MKNLYLLLLVLTPAFVWGQTLDDSMLEPINVSYERVSHTGNIENIIQSALDGEDLVFVNWGDEGGLWLSQIGVSGTLECSQNFNENSQLTGVSVLRESQTDGSFRLNYSVTNEAVKLTEEIYLVEGEETSRRVFMDAPHFNIPMDIGESIDVNTQSYYVGDFVSDTIWSSIEYSISYIQNGVTLVTPSVTYEDLVIFSKTGHYQDQEIINYYFYLPTNLVVPVVYTTVEFNSLNIHLFEEGVGQREIIKEKDVSFYPNPTHDVLNFSKPVSQIEVYSCTGSLVMSEQQQGMQSVDLSDLEPGLYLVKTEFGTERVIKR